MAACARGTRAAIAVAIVAAVVGGAGVARADQRPVAVIDLVDSRDPSLDTAQLDTSLADELEQNPDLEQLTDSALAAALKGPFTADDKDVDHVDRARQALGGAYAALDQFSFANAEAAALSGETLLFDVAPATAAPIYADLALARGQALLGLRKPKEAAASFALVHRLAPARPPLDPARYLPEIVQAYDAAGAPATAAGAIEIAGTGEVWLDGARVGTAPGVFAASAGEHLVQLAGPARFPRGQRVTVADRAHVAVDLPAADATVAEQVARERALLAMAADATEQASAIDRIAKLVGVSDAVILSVSTTAPHALQWQVWTDHAPGLTAPQPVGNSTPRDLLAPLAPPRAAIEVPMPPERHDIIIDTDEPLPPWYRRRWVQASVAAGVVAIVVGSVLWATRTQEHPLGSPTISIVNPP